MKVVVSGQEYEAYEINANVTQTFFLLYINNLSKNNPSLLVSIYADDTTIYVCTSKKQYNQNLAADLSFDQVLTTQWEEN